MGWVASPAQVVFTASEAGFGPCRLVLLVPFRLWALVPGARGFPVSSGGGEGGRVNAGFRQRQLAGGSAASARAERGGNPPALQVLQGFSLLLLVLANW